MAYPITTTAFTLFACVGARCSISMQRGLTTCCRIFADMGRKWRKRSSCRSHPELVIIAAKHKSKEDMDL
jgi:hypothetical protein